MEKCDEKLKLLLKSSCKSEAGLNLNQKPVTPCPCVPVMFPYSQKYCLFMAPISFMCLCKAQQHLNQASDCQAGHSIKRKWKTCSRIPEVWLASLRGAQPYFCDSFIRWDNILSSFSEWGIKKENSEGLSLQRWLNALFFCSGSWF